MEMYIKDKRVRKMNELELMIRYKKSTINKKVNCDLFPPRYIQVPGRAAWLVDDIDEYLFYSSSEDRNLNWSEYVLKSYYPSDWKAYLQNHTITVFEHLAQHKNPVFWKKYSDTKSLKKNLTIIEYLVQKKSPNLWIDYKKSSNTTLTISISRFLVLIMQGADHE